MSEAVRRVVVIGGGVIGTACAHFLVRSGWRVTIVEQGAFGQGASAGNCGLVTPSHILPLAEPGAIGRTIVSMFKKNSPFTIKPRADPALWSWLIGFALRCNARDMIEGGRAIQSLLESSLSLYEDLMRTEGIDCEWKKNGLMFVFKNNEDMKVYAETDRLLGETFHCSARRFVGQDLTDLEPALNDGLAGGWYYEDDGHLRPDKLMTSWRKRLEHLGVSVIENCSFTGFHNGSGIAGSVATSTGEIAADAFVVAAGALTPLLNEHLGCRIPIQPGKGYSLTMPRPSICPKIPLIFPETRVAVTPFQSGYRLGSTMEFAGYDSTLNQARLQLLKEGAEPYLREPYREPIEQGWYGWRPMTYDSLPIIDKSPILNNVVIAAGHNMLGLSMAPATGKLVAEMLGGAAPHIDPAPYRVDRF